MLKKNFAKRIAAGVLAMIVAATTVLSGVGSTMTAEAASAYENQNLLVNPDFEESAAFTATTGGSHLGNWFYWQNAAKTTETAQSGSTSAKFTGDDSALEQDVSGLIAGNTYVYTVWARVSSDITTKTHSVGVKNYGGTEIKQYITSTEWTKYELEFTYTSGNPRVYGYVSTHGGVDLYIDNASLTLKSDIENVSIKNGELTAKFADTFEGVPSTESLTANYAIGNGAASALTWTNVAWDADTKTAVLKFDEVAQTPAEQTVTVNLTYNGATITLDYTVDSNGETPVDPEPSEPERTDANIYYVDSTNGSDDYDGLSPETAFASIDKLNEITFIPGDQILFKKGETFVGCFKPQGSGNEEAPIKIGSYGEGDARPVLQPGADWQVSHVMSAGAIVYNAKVNYVIQFYNVEYWEVSDLELYDPNSEAYLTQGSGKWIGNSANDVYRSGITVQAEDIGTLEHIYIDNMIIHGFHGPGTNIGKTSGGITMNVITNSDRNRSLSVPTQINDIRITNCEIYDVGRSGINFLTPWSFRTDEKWGPFNYGQSDYEYLPYEGFYMANNYIHDVDGDGTIIDNCVGAIAEYNLVTRCCLRPATTGGGAAVGLFNWNSDDTIFQFNEVYDVRNGSGSSASNDGQGIEIDALNDRTWVQYNYVHDNMGGFMMLCNVGDSYRSFDGIVRYNISQNDYTHPRQGLFDIYSANYGTEIYNNTFYLTDRAVSQNGYGNYADAGELFLFSAVGAYETMKFYNNIFYYDGETPVTANQFGDSAIDWQSNIFYNFANMPVDDNENAPNLAVDPMLADIGNGGTGAPEEVLGAKQEGSITWVDLSCYELLAGSPAINAGVPLEDSGGRDYFGNPVTGIPDIGAYESGSVVLKLLSTNPEIVISQEEMTITVTDTAKITARTLLDSLVYEDGVTVKANRDSAILKGGIRLADGDVVTGTYKGQSITYTVKVVEGEEEYKVIPPERTNATAGSEETVSSSDHATNVLDGNVGTIWHTAWGGAAAADRYLTLEIKDEYSYEISGYVYTPRTGSSSGAVNGIITGYEIYVSDDNATWEKVAEGTWVQDSTVKTVMFEEPVQAKYVKLLAITSVGNYASAAEARLIGEIVDTDLPTTPAISAEDATNRNVKLNWTAAEDENGIAEYVLAKDGKEIAVFDADVTSYTVTRLEGDTEYTFTVYAVDNTGKKSEVSSVTVTTAKGPNVIRLKGADRYATSLAVAEEYQNVLGVDEFDAVIVATGQKAADALSGSYLAAQKKAPILLTDEGKEASLIEYVKENLAAGGTVYLLGGTGVVSADLEAELGTLGYNVKRLKGTDRYGTNLAILEEAGITGNDLLVATGEKEYDSLSASATNKPILLVNTEITEAQKEVLEGLPEGSKIWILGGTGAVSADIEAELKEYSNDVERVKGADRYATSVEIAKTFFGEDAAKVTMAYGEKFPDGLCGGPLAAEIGAPVLLVKEGGTDKAAVYAANAASGYVFGGSGVIADETVKAVLGEEIKIVGQKYE